MSKLTAKILCVIIMLFVLQLTGNFLYDCIKYFVVGSIMGWIIDVIYSKKDSNDKKDNKDKIIIYKK